MTKIAFIGFGEAGQALARGLRPEGVTDLRAYDILFDEPADRGRLRARAAEFGVACAAGHAEAVREADMVFLAVTVASSLAAARSCVSGLARGAFFLDINSVSPQRKRETAALVGATGARYVEVAVMAPVGPHGHKVPLLIGGPGAHDWLPQAGALGMRAEQVSEKVGQASAIKMLRSIMVKGIEALMVESMLGASEYGVEDRVLATLQESHPGIDWQRLSGYAVERVVTHGRRRAEELCEVAQTLRSIGIEPLMADAIAERQKWVADLGVNARHSGGKSEGRAELIGAIRAAMGRPPAG